MFWKHFFSKDIGIDLGTANVLLYVKGQGIVLNEPSVVAIDEKTNRVLAVGQEAHDMLGRTPGKIKAIKPLKDGVIADFEVTRIMLEHFINKVHAKSMFSKPRILICCPSNITQVERNAIIDAAERTGAKKVYIEEEPKVAAVGSGMDISKPSGNMVIDIGGGTTDVAVLSLGDIVQSASLKVAGQKFDQDISKYVKDKYKLLIGELTAEVIKKKIATCIQPKVVETLEIKGRDLVTGLPKTIKITSEDTFVALRDSVYEIVRTAKSVLEQTDPELAADIIDHGVVLTGGGSLLNGLVEIFTQELKIPVYIADNPIDCVAIGTGIMLENLSLISGAK